jgi:hypothetical protein
METSVTIRPECLQPAGDRSGKRLKETFPTRAKALAWERHIRAKVQEVPDWMPA